MCGGRSNAVYLLGIGLVGVAGICGRWRRSLGLKQALHSVEEYLESNGRPVQKLAEILCETRSHPDKTGYFAPTRITASLIHKNRQFDR